MWICLCLQQADNGEHVVCSSNLRPIWGTNYLIILKTSLNSHDAISRYAHDWMEASPMICL